MTDYQLILLAVAARRNAYAPYSGFRVGVALLGKSGKLYPGCNVENASYSATNCAERTAIFRAVSEGEREFDAIAIVGGQGDALLDFCAPCGVCRQVLSEFCGSDFRVVLGTPENYKSYTLGELLPYSFGKKDLE